MLIRKLSLNYQRLAEINPAVATADIKTHHLSSPINAIRMDLPRLCFVDFTGRTTREMKDNWLILDNIGQYQLASGVEPNYPQGRLDNAIAGDYFKAMALANLDPETTTTKIVAFHYINNQEQPCAFYLCLINYNEALLDEKGNEVGHQPGSIWLSAITQNINASEEQKKATILASSNFSALPPLDEEEDLNNADKKAVTESLSEAIGNKEVAMLVQDIFMQENELDVAGAAQNVMKRIANNKNIDDRDRKNAQLDFLSKVVTQLQHKELISEIERLKHQGQTESNFFIDANFTNVYENLITQVAQAIVEQKEQTADIDSIRQKLSDLSSKYAENILSEYIPEKILEKVPPSPQAPGTTNNSSFINRNSLPLGLGGFGITTIAAVGAALILAGIFPPFLIGFIAGIAIISVTAIVAATINNTEKQHANTINEIKITQENAEKQWETEQLKSEARYYDYKIEVTAISEQIENELADLIALPKKQTELQPEPQSPSLSTAPTFFNEKAQDNATTSEVINNAPGNDAHERDSPKTFQ